MDYIHVIIMAVIFLLLCLYFLIKIGKEHNKTNWDHNGLNILDGINTWLCRKYHRLPEKLIEIPNAGPAILISNHISGLDPLLLIAATNRPLRFMIAQEEFNRWWLKWLLIRVGCIPVNRDKNPTKAFNASLIALKNDQIVVVFPQGRIVTKANPGALKKGAFVLAKTAKVPLLCLRIDGVYARGLTLLAPFVRSNANLSRHQTSYRVTDENIGDIMEQINQYFH